MKKLLSILFVLIMAWGLLPPGPCAAETPAAEESGIVLFADPVLESMVRESLGKQSGDITTADAEAVIRINLSIEWQRYHSADIPFTDISGLENFTNLESLDLSFHQIRDVSPLAGLKKLTTLSLGGNPVSDLTPLAGLTNLEVLNLSGCTAPDYSPLGNLINLKVLLLSDSAITDVSPLAALTNLKVLYLANSPVTSYAPLTDLYPDLEKMDFKIAATLLELGFTFDDNTKMAVYDSDSVSVSINHAYWGTPAMEGESNIVRVTLQLESGYTLSVGFYPEIDAYVFGMVRNDETLANYVYDPANGGFTLGMDEREQIEQVLQSALSVDEGEEILLAPIPIFNETIQNIFNLSANELYKLPMEQASLRSLGFYPDQDNAVCLFEYRVGRDVNLEVHRPEWGEKDFDVRFFKSLSDEYRVVITWKSGESKIMVKADDLNGGGASFDVFGEPYEHVDTWWSDDGLTVEEYFTNAYDDPAIEDIYLYSVQLMEQFFLDTFSMTFEELYELPGCE